MLTLPPPFLRFIMTCKELYVTSTKKQKMKISRSIVEAVRSLQPPGRFLEKHPSNGTWYDIGDKKAVEKTSQALRDGAAFLRKQLSEDLGDPDFLSAVFDSESRSTASPISKKTFGEKKKPPAKGHRRTKSNPTVLAAVRAKVVIKRHKMDVPSSPNKPQLSRHHRPPLSPMSPHARSPRTMMSPVSPLNLSQGTHAGHRRGHSMPTVPHPMPGSPIYRDNYQYRPPGPGPGPGPGSHNSFEWAPEGHDFGPPPPRPYGPPKFPPFAPPQSPGNHHHYQYHAPHHQPHPLQGNSSGSYRRPHSNSPFEHDVSPRWSPHYAFNRNGSSLSPHPPTADVQHNRPPDFRPPLGVSPRMQYPRGGCNNQFGSSSNLSVPALGGEQSHGPPLPLSPRSYPHQCPPSFYHRQSPSIQQYLPAPHEFNPPIHHPPYRRSPVGSFHCRMETPVDNPNKYGPDDEEMHDREVGITNISGYERNDSSYSHPNAKKSNSPAAVVDVTSSQVIVKDEVMMSPIRGKKIRDGNFRNHAECHPSNDDDDDDDDDGNNDYPSDEDPNPAADDVPVSPLPFDLHDEPSTLMELPTNLLSLPIPPYGPYNGDIRRGQNRGWSRDEYEV